MIEMRNYLDPKRYATPFTLYSGWKDETLLISLSQNVHHIYHLSSNPIFNRFYKNADKVGKVLHVGTVVEGPSEYFSSRLSKKGRKQTIVEEILGDKTLKDYSKRKYSEIQYEKSNKKKMFKTKKGKR